MLRSSILVQSKKVGEETTLQQSLATSLEGKVSHVQALAGELEKQLAEARAWE